MNKKSLIIFLGALIVIVVLMLINKKSLADFNDVNKKTKDNIMQYIESVDKHYSLAEATLGAESIERSLNKDSLDFSLKTVNEAIAFIEKISIPNECLNYHEMTVNALKLIKQIILDRQEYGERVFSEEEFGEIMREQLRVEADRNIERTKLLRSIDFWRTKELGITPENLNEFERGADGKYKKKDNDKE